MATSSVWPVTLRSVEVASIQPMAPNIAVNADPYYQENLALGDLPAGVYKVSFRYADEDRDRQTWVEIFPGQVSYFKFDGKNGFSTERPPAPTLDFLPFAITTTPPP